MEIELPDGTVLDAPDDADPKQVVRGYRMAKLKSANPGEYDLQSKEYAENYGPTDANNFREGIGSGMTRMNKGLGNMFNKALDKVPATRILQSVVGDFDMPNKEFYSDESIREQDRLDQPLARTTGGRVGQTVGQAAVGMAATAPISGLGALANGGNILLRTLASPTTRAALEGAVSGGAGADPDQQLRGAMFGGAAGGATNLVLRGLGRVTRGLVNKNEAVRDLEDIAGKKLGIPISQAASDEDFVSRNVRSLYQEGLPNVLGVKGIVARQSKEALKRARESTGSGGLADELIEEVFSEPVSRGTRAGKLLTTLGLGGSAVYGDPVYPVVVVLGGWTMATKTVQRALMGDTAAQAVLQKVVEKNPNLASVMQRFIQQVGATEAGDDSG